MGFYIMVSPVSNGLPQQIPASNTFQPGGSTENIREKENRDTARTAAASSTSTSESRAADSTHREERETTVSASSRDEDNGQARARTDRGSVLDVVV